MKVSVVCVVVSMMVTLDMSYACTQSLIADCSSSMQSSLKTIKTKSEACRILDTYLYCVRSCENLDKWKKLGYGILSVNGIKCGESKTGTVVGSSTPQVIEYKDMSYSCEPSVMADCRRSMESAFSNVITYEQVCRDIDSFIYCARSCGSQNFLKKLRIGILYDRGIECGSATMVTLSGTMVMLMLFTSLRNFL